MKSTGIGNEGGTSYNWSDVLEFKIKAQNFIILSLWTGSHLQPEIIGTGIYSIEHLLDRQEVKEWLKLTHDDQIIGEICFEAEIWDKENSFEDDQDTQFSIINSYGDNQNPKFYGNHISYTGIPTYSHAASPPTKNLMMEDFSDLNPDHIISEFQAPSDLVSHNENFESPQSHSSEDEQDIFKNLEINLDIWHEEDIKSIKSSGSNLPPSYTVPYNPFSVIV